MSPHINQPADCPTYRVLGGDVITIRATGETTGGAFTLLETTVPPGGGPPPHVHTREDESFYVVEGEFEFRTPGDTRRIGPGAFVFAPRNVPHAFRNVGAAPGKLIVFVQPAGFERFLAEFATLPPDAPPDFARMAAIAARHGLQFVQSV
jgi:quercetin dioxygenase-like cupin family protein